MLVPRFPIRATGTVNQQGSPTEVASSPGAVQRGAGERGAGDRPIEEEPIEEEEPEKEDTASERVIGVDHGKH